MFDSVLGVNQGYMSNVCVFVHWGVGSKIKTLGTAELGHCSL